MRLFYILLLSLLPLGRAALTTQSVVEACTTEFGSTSGLTVAKTTTTYTLSQIGTVTSFPSTTVTPKPSTVTVISTTFLTSTKTIGTVKTFTSTTTVISTNTAAVTATASVTPAPVVSVTITPTSTVPTSPGQVFQSDSYYNKNKRNLPVHPHKPRGNVPTTSAVKTTYPQAITCGLLIDIYGFVTATASKTNTVTACASTVKATSTVTSTVFSTNCHASVTSTSTTNIVVSSPVSTLTTTVTVADGPPTTVTVAAATTTVYAACVTENLLTYDTTEGAYISHFYDASNNLQVPTNTSYDCCVACQNAGGCGGAAYNANTGICTVDQGSQGGTCDPSSVSKCYDSWIGCDSVNGEFGYGLVFYPDAPSFEGYTISAGPCGQASEGLDGTPPSNDKQPPDNSGN